MPYTYWAPRLAACPFPKHCLQGRPMCGMFTALSVHCQYSNKITLPCILSRLSWRHTSQSRVATTIIQLRLCQLESFSLNEYCIVLYWSIILPFIGTCS